MNKYPRLRGERSVRPQGICVVCQKRGADMRVDLQHNQFRGDDDVIKVHRKCLPHLERGSLLATIIGIEGGGDE